MPAKVCFRLPQRVSNRLQGTSTPTQSFNKSAGMHMQDANKQRTRRPCLHFVCFCKALGVGDRLQDYPDYYRVLQKSSGGGVALSSLEKKKPVVLFFYPKAGTPGCTKQACKFRDEYGKFVDKEVEVFGISSDTPEKNAEFAQQQRLPFPLLTDQSDFLRKSFGIKGDLFGMLKGRQTFVIDKEGKCVMSFNDQLGAEKHVAEALQVLETLA